MIIKGVPLPFDSLTSLDYKVYILVLGLIVCD